MFMKIIYLFDRNFTRPLFQRLSDVADANISTEILYVRWGELLLRFVALMQDVPLKTNINMFKLT